MLITEISIKRPVFATMVMIALLVVGLVSYSRLSIDELPNVEFPIAVVNVVYPGSSPEVIEKEVVKKIEESVNTVQDVKRITSTSYQGLANVIIEFKLERNKDAAVQDVRDAVSRIRKQLPEEIDEPVVRNYDPTSMPIMGVALTSTTMGVRELSDLAEEVIKKKLENSYGVGQVSIIGDLTRQINIYLNPQLMVEKRVSVQDVIKVLRDSNQEIPVGEFERSESAPQIRVKGKIKSPEEFKELIVSTRNQVPIRLKDIARVEDSIKEPISKAFYNTKSIVALDIRKIKGANTVEISKGIKKKVDEINKTLGSGTKLNIVKDNSVSISDSVKELTLSIVLGIILTILIVYIFLNSWRSTVITGLTLPISLLSTFAVMAACGFTINVMTLIALSLSVGLVIDDAIVVRENIVRHLHMGKGHKEAALEGTKEIGLAVMATTFTIVAVFFPVAFMGGITGRFFTEFGITVSSAVLVSLFVSFTLDPMLSSIWRDPQNHTSFVGKSLEKFNDKFEDLASLYKKTITFVLHHRWLTLLVIMGMFVASCFLVPLIGVSFVPEQDKSQVRVELKTPVNSSLDFTTRKTIEVIRYLRKLNPEIKFVYTTVGGGFTNEKYRSIIYLKLVPKHERKRGQAEILKAVRKQLSNFAGVKASVSAEGKGGPGDSPIQVSIQGDDQVQLEKVAAKVFQIAKGVPGAADIDSSLEKNRDNVNLQIDRKKVADLGLNFADISNALRYVYSGESATKWQSPSGEEYDVLVRLPKSLRGSEEVLKETYFVSNSNIDGVTKLIPLQQIASFEKQLDYSKISHRDLFREILVTGNVEGRSPGEVIKDIKAKIEEQLTKPPGFRVSFGGESEDIQEAAFYGAQALILAIIFIYLIMASQFNSFIQPLAIMLTLPLALIGVFITLFLCKDTLNLLSMIGILTLMGLVTKNGILLVDFANQKRNKDGMELKDALAQAGQTRLRPIIMTSLAASLGILPLAMGIGEGAELRGPMARAIIGGVATSTLLTLYAIPVAYSLLEDGWHWIEKKFIKK
jgi:HAE1 family hydrophobic/amphiphilic exporter-1